MLNPTELETVAKGVTTIIGLVAVLSPLVSLPLVRHFQLGGLGPFIFVGEIVSLGCFIAPLFYRNDLHLLPPFWVFILAGLVAVVGLTGTMKPDPSAVRLCAILLFFCLAVGFIMFGITVVAAQSTLFYKLHGNVYLIRDKPADECPVYLHSATGAEYFRTTTDQAGDYEFLLTHAEAERAGEVRAGEDQRVGANWAVVDWELAVDSPPRQHRESTLRVRRELCIP